VKFPACDKVFFHFFQNILNARRNTLVAPWSHSLPFYRISQGLPRKKFRKIAPLFMAKSKWSAVSFS